jgi:hypothetical protein
MPESLSPITEATTLKAALSPTSPSRPLAEEEPARCVSGCPHA